MPITDPQVAALRALLAQNIAEHDRLVTELGGEGVRAGYYPLVTAAFGLAVWDRFADADPHLVAAWLHGASTMAGAGGSFDVSVAAKLVAWILGRDENTLEFGEQFTHLTMLLGLLMYERQPDDAELDAFLERARVYADGVAATRGA